MINDEDNPKFWENIYKNDDAGWDLGGPTPVFVKISSILKPKKLCIIGCGRGYDAVMFAKNNFDVTAVDFAPSAVTSLRILARENKVIINVLEQDIFSLASQYDNHFDYVIEQTCFCAIHPNKRAEYEKLVYRILKTNGKLIGLWFPLDKNINEGGPPYGTTVKEVKSLFKDRWMLESEEFPKDSIKPRKSREKLLIFEKFENSID
tara:strand:- start:917 stop:1534 length:618 start_codon:yes stop_codon:yes gene_type:complete